MNSYLLLYVVWVGAGLWAALRMRSLGPNWLMFWSVVFVAYGSVPSIGMLVDSKSLNNPHFEFIGQALLFFFRLSAALSSPQPGQNKGPLFEMCNAPHPTEA